MISFLNDYNEACHPKILEEIGKMHTNKYVGYSEDELVEKAITLIKKELKDENVEIHFVHGGTIANVLAIMNSLQRFESVISASSGHIVNTENGSIEAIGHQIVIVPEVDGKVTVENAKIALKAHSHEYNSKPKLVYISNVTELGTVYKKSELQELRSFCDENNLYLFMDGARLATAMMSNENDIKFSELTKYCDVFTIGGTKNGLLFGEAIVFVNESMKDNYYRLIMKQRGAMLAKGFLYGVQFKTMFEDGLYYELARNAVEKADNLKKIFIEKGYKLLGNAEANLVFIEMDIETHTKLKEKVLYQYDEIDESKGKARFVTSWNTSDDDIEKLETYL